MPIQQEDELEVKICEKLIDYDMGGSWQEHAAKQIMQLIKERDSKLVREARIDELKGLLNNLNEVTLRDYGGNDRGQLKFVDIPMVEDRIKELKEGRNV